MEKTKKRLLTIGELQSVTSKIPRQLVLAFVAACIVFLIVHGGFFDDRMVNEDYNHYISTDLQRIYLGRFICFPLITYSCNSWTLGFETCLYLALSATLLVDILKVRTRIGAVVAAVLTVGMPALSYMFGYLASAPLYGRLYFLTVLAIWVADRWRWGFLPAIVIFALALGVGQAAMIAGVILCVLILLRDLLLEDNFGYKPFFNKFLKLLLMGTVGVALYFILWKIILNITGMTISDYKGMNQIGSVTLPQILDGIKRCYTDFYGYFFGSRFYFVSTVQKVAYAVFFGAFMVAVVFACIKSPLKIPGIIVALLLFPLCVGCIQIVIPQVTTDTLMVYPIVYLMVLTITAAETCMPSSVFGHVASWLLIISLCVTGISHYDVTSNYYVKAETYHENTAAYENRLLMRIEETPGYYPGIPVAILANGTNNYRGLDESSFPHVLNDRGYWYSFTGTKYDEPGKTFLLMSSYIGVNLTRATNQQIQQVRDADETADMTVYPLPGSTKVVNGILVVNWISRDVQVRQVSDNSVFIRNLNHEASDGSETYFWYVFRNSVRDFDLEKACGLEKECLLTLPEDGTYTFRGCCKRGDKVMLVDSVSVVVKDGVISADSGLKRISEEEAASVETESEI